MTAALIQTTAGATIGISATLPATDDAVGYAALTFTAIGEIPTSSLAVSTQRFA